MVSIVFMAKLERSKERRKSSLKKKSDFEDYHKGKRDSGRGPKRNNRDGRFSRNKRNIEMTKVICSDCGKECEVPFKPTSSKPVYCSDCFEKKEKGSSHKKFSNNDIDIINEKLNKIMKALDIE
jgi:CxxC-x17-CxxC domain-containing protein